MEFKRNEDENIDIDKSRVPTLSDSSKKMSRAIFFNLLSTYGLIPLNFIITMIISRSVDGDIWGICLYATIITTSGSIILNFIPPSIDTIIIYRFPELYYDNKKGHVKGIAYYFLKIKIVISTLIAVSFFVYGLYFWKYSQSLLHLSILISSFSIVFNEVNSIFHYILTSLKLYKNTALVLIIQKLFFLLSYVFLSLNNWSNQTELIVLSIISVFSVVSLTPIYIFLFSKHFKKYPKEKVSWDDIRELSVFGFTYSLYRSAFSLYNQIFSASINSLGVSKYNVYNNLCNNMTNFALSGSKVSSNAPILSDLIQSNQKKEMMYLFTKSFMILNILICVIIGVLHFITPVYVNILYTSEYYSVIPIAQIFVLVAYFNNLNSNFATLYSVTKNHKKFSKISIISAIISSILALIAATLLDFQEIMFSKLVGFGILVFISWFYAYRRLDGLKIGFRTVFQNFIVLVLIIMVIDISYPFLQRFILIDCRLDNILVWISDTMNETFNVTWFNLFRISLIFDSIMQLILFIILFVAYLILFRIITISDIEKIERLELKIPFKKIFMKIGKKILRN